MLNLWGRGRQDYEAELRALAGEDLDRRIFFKGAYELDVLDGVFGNMDVALAPVIWEEAQGMVVQEALAATLPVIGTNLGGVGDWIQDGVNGRLLEFGNGLPEALAEAMIDIVNHPARLEEWRGNIGRMPSVAEHAVELIELYGKV